MTGWAQTFPETIHALMCGNDINVPIDGGDLNGSFPTLFTWSCGSKEACPIQFAPRTLSTALCTHTDRFFRLRVGLCCEQRSS